ncbi:MAG: ParB N-terminal domain-containing protein, partial [Firmicutes bacterium]|nr:ParB N-terminal domain-containing protein [Bacillota bacterium]
YNRIKQAMEKGEIMPPVVLYKVRDKYYVVDGNHRVSAAKAVGQTYIDAEVIEFFPPPDSEPNLIWREKSSFEMKTGLTQIELTELGSYNKLLQQIEEFREEESLARGYQLSLPEASMSWKQEIYKPVLALITKQRLLEEFPHRTAADLFLYASYHRMAKSRLTKQKVSYRQALADFKIEEPNKTFADKVREIINSLFALDEPESSYQGLIFDEDGLVRVTRSRTRREKADLIISDEDTFFD